MKKYVHSIQSDSYSLLCSGRFWMAVGGILLVNLLNVWNELATNPLCNVYYLFVMRKSLGGFFIITICFSAVCYSDAHLSAVKNGYFYPEMVRKGLFPYCLSKILVVGFGTFLAAFAGNLLFAFVLRVCCPFLLTGEGNMKYFLEAYRTPFTSLYLEKGPLLFVMAEELPEAMCYGFLGTFALMISGWCRNLFVLYASPLIFYYISLHLSDSWKLPKLFSWFSVMENGICPERDCLENLLLTGIYYLGLSIFCGLIFLKRVEYLKRKGDL